MGLPVELWSHTIRFLARDPLSLLACALTCKSLHILADDMLKDLRSRHLDPSGYEDVDQLAQEAFDSPKGAQCLEHLTVQPNLNASRKGTIAAEAAYPVALSVMPFLLSKKHRRLSTMIIDLHVGAIVDLHPDTWRLFGYSFCCVTELTLHAIVFPSFVDYMHLISSFRSLIALSLSDLSCRNQRITPTITSCPRKDDLQLQTLKIISGTTAEETWFQETLVYWFIRRSGSAHNMMSTDKPAVGRAPARRFLHQVRGKLQTLEIWSNAFGLSIGTDDNRLPCRRNGTTHGISITFSIDINPGPRRLSAWVPSDARDICPWMQRTRYTLAHVPSGLFTGSAIATEDIRRGSPYPS